MKFHEKYYGQLKGYKVTNVTFEDDGMGGVFPKLHMWNIKADKGYERLRSNCHLMRRAMRVDLHSSISLIRRRLMTEVSEVKETTVRCHDGNTRVTCVTV